MMMVVIMTVRIVMKMNVVVVIKTMINRRKTWRSKREKGGGKD